MCCKGFLKRAVPFFLTFLVGILIAGIFIPIGGSNFQFRKNRWQKHREYHERTDSEIQRLREENEQLRKQLEEKQNLKLEGIGEGDVPRIRLDKRVKIVQGIGDVDAAVPPPPPLPAAKK